MLNAHEILERILDRWNDRSQPPPSITDVIGAIEQAKHALEIQDADTNSTTRS